MTNSEPTLVVERERIAIESGRVYANGATTAVDSQTVEQLVFVPQFQPSTLTDEQRRLYDGLREFHDEEHGALVIDDAFVPAFEAGETLTLQEATRRGRERLDEIREVMANVFEIAKEMFNRRTGGESGDD